MIATRPGLSPAGLVAEEIQRYEALLQVLEAESAALCRLDYVALQHAADAKQDVVANLELLAREREVQVRAQGYALTENGIRRWLAASDARDDGAWDRLRKVARAARDANARNGRMLARSNQHFSSALHALLDAAGVPSVYGADGTARRPSSSRVHAAT